MPKVVIEAAARDLARAAKHVSEGTPAQQEAHTECASEALQALRSILKAAAPTDTGAFGAQRAEAPPQA